MQGDGLIGLNVDGVKAQVTNFAEKAQEVLNSIETAYNNFMTATSKCWASDHAVNFQQFADGKEYGFESDFISICNKKLTDVRLAVQVFTGAQGNPVACDYVPLAMKNAPGAVVFTNNINGTVGMNVTKVDTLFTDYSTALENVKKAVEGLTKTISIYDLSGAVMQSYSTEVTAIIDEFTTHANSLKAEIESYVDQERDNAELGAEQGAAAMGGN